MNKLLILGSSGMLGNMVSKYFINTNEFDIFLTYRNNKQNYPHENSYKFDALTDDLEKLIKDINPDFLINCIGLIKPEINEESNESVKKALEVNSYFPLKISNLASEHNFKFIQIGTDCVFSGATGEYLESSFQDAIDVYGKSKIGGEVVNLNKYLIRGSIVGPEAGQGQSLLNWFLNQGEGKVNGFIDHMWNGITTLNFAKIVHGMIKTNNFKNNIQHVIPKDEVSKYDLLIYFKKFFGVDVKVEKINSENSVNRTLKTENEDANKTLWLDAGYENIPTIEENIKELSESSLTKGILNTI